MRKILEGSHLVLRQSALATDVQNRTLGSESRRNARHRVRASGPGRRHDATETSRLPGIAIGGVSRHLFVPHVDDTDTFIHTTIVDVYDVPTTEGEDRVDTLIPQSPCRQVAARDDVARSILAHQCIGRGIAHV